MKNSLKEMEEKTNKEFEEVNKSLKHNQETAIKQEKEMIQDLKTERDGHLPHTQQFNNKADRWGCIASLSTANVALADLALLPHFLCLDKIH